MRFDITPIGKPRMTQSDKWKKRPCVLRYREYADILRLLAKVNGYELKDSLYATFVLPMPSSWSKTKKEKMNGQPHVVKPDLDNVIKAFQDILCKQDQSIHTYKCRKIYGYEGSIKIHNNEIDKK